MLARNGRLRFPAYEHHANQKALKLSARKCELCWKIYKAFEVELHRKRGKISNFEDTAPALVIVWIRMQALQDGIDDNGRELVVVCGKLEISSWIYQHSDC